MGIADVESSSRGNGAIQALNVAFGETRIGVVNEACAGYGRMVDIRRLIFCEPTWHPSRVRHWRHSLVSGQRWPADAQIWVA